MKLNKLTKQEKSVIVDKGTEPPFVGEYDNFFEGGIYTCRQCDTPLFRSEDKFQSHCGWPSFDNEIQGAVQRIPDADGQRTEIVCARCSGHLGHVFEGERLTDKNIRHCVNSISMKFVSSDELREKNSTQTKSAFFAGGCFWGVEHLFQNVVGVSSVVSGYMGGDTEEPTYQEVCGKTTGHLEVVAITYDPEAVSFTELAKLFFEIHDPTQANGQGPDIGPQYASAIFYNDAQEKEIAQSLIKQLEGLGYNVVTDLRPHSKFWEAEDYHQNYYARNGKEPYCHTYTKRFAD